MHISIIDIPGLSMNESALLLLEQQVSLRSRDCPPEFMISEDILQATS